MMMRQSGLTIIEMMIGIAIVAVIMVQAVPSMNGYFRDSAIRRVADEMRMGVQLAKSEAIRRNDVVQFVPAATGWSVQAVPAGGGNIVINSRTAQGSEAQVNAAASAANVSFNGRGRANMVGMFTVNITNPTAGGCQDAGGIVRCLSLTVSRSGQIRLCDPVLAAADPRSC